MPDRAGSRRGAGVLPASVVGESAVAPAEVGSLPGQRGIAAGSLFVELDPQTGTLRQREAVAPQFKLLRKQVPGR